MTPIPTKALSSPSLNQTINDTKKVRMMAEVEVALNLVELVLMVEKVLNLVVE